MIVHSLVLSCCLLAQAADPALPQPGPSPKKHRSAAPAANPPAEGAPAATEGGHRGRSVYDPAATQDAGGGTAGDRGGEMGQVDRGASRMRPPELLADALSGPHEGRMASRPLPLVDALARATDRQQQRQIATAYWRLATAQAQLHFAHRNLKYLSGWTHPGQKHSSLTSSQLATAEAAIDDAEFRVINEGEALAMLVGWPDKDQIPATVDRPHVGAYRTEFDRLFSSSSPPPPRLRLIHRTLPISRRAIDVHGTALVAASEALEVTREEYHDQKTDYLTLTAAFDRMIAEQTAFLASVLRYNEDIAEYAFFVVPATADPAFLAKRLITRPAPSSQGRADQPDAADESFDAESNGAERGETRPRTFRDASPPANDESPDDPSAMRRPRAKIRLVAVEKSAEPAHGGLYQGLLGAEPALQAQRLAAVLHWDMELPVDAGQKLPLVECVARVPQSGRRAAIAAYWGTREQAAHYQVLGQRSEALTALASKLLTMRAKPGGAEAMLRLHAAREAAQAAVLDQHIRLLTSQYDLLMLLESSSDRPLPLPTTPPRGGDYPVVDSDKNQREGWHVADGQPMPGGAGTRVVVLHKELTERASALVFADEFRAVHTTAEPSRPAEIDGVLWAIDRQLRKTEVFLGTLTDYNLAVADFVLPRLPPDTPAKSVVDKLVVEPPAEGEKSPGPTGRSQVRPRARLIDTQTG